MFLPGEFHSQGFLVGHSPWGSWWATVHGVLKSQTQLSDGAQHTAYSQIESDKEHALHNRYIGANITKLNLEDSILFFKGKVLVE